MDFNRVFEIPEYQAARFAQEAACAGRGSDAWEIWSIQTLLERRDALSAGMLRLGLNPGDRIAVLAHAGSPAWLALEYAIMQIGAIAVPLHGAARSEELAEILQDAQPAFAWVSHADMLAKLRSCGVSLPPLGALAPLDGEPLAARWEDLVSAPPDEASLRRIGQIRDTLSPDSLAAILYTSGATGQPKGVMLTHRNIVSNVKSLLAVTPLEPGMRSLSFLPISHVFERTVALTCQAAGMCVWFAPGLSDLGRTLQEAKPHFFAAVPRVLERFLETIREQNAQLPAWKRRIAGWALKFGLRYPAERGIQTPRDWLRLWTARLLVFRRLRKRLGGELRAIVVGAAALPEHLARLFAAAGIAVREGYGLTESSPVVSFNRFEPGGMRFGTVGQPIPGVRVRIAQPNERGEGEIEVSGPNVTQGYWRHPEATAARFTPDGWLRTGDLGRIEGRNFLRITGRASEVFKTASGKFVAPERVEQALRAEPLVSQCMIAGLNQSSLSALIVPDFNYLEHWCARHQIHWTAPPYMILNLRVAQAYQALIDRLNAQTLDSHERIGAFTLLHEAWTPENGLLTPTLKLRRQALKERFKTEWRDMEKRILVK
ncbi:MAG: AMP-dependent synthetase/ligase [Saprospiraceae bacterium]